MCMRPFLYFVPSTFLPVPFFALSKALALNILITENRFKDLAIIGVQLGAKYVTSFRLFGTDLRIFCGATGPSALKRSQNPSRIYDDLRGKGVPAVIVLLELIKQA
ncbi:hypothetical protein BC567DRAFT_226056 [Phyllosticta citribraziliensis]